MNYRRLPNSANGYDYKVRSHTQLRKRRSSIIFSLMRQSQEVGKWFNELVLDPADVIWPREQSAIPSSVCSQACGIGEVKITQQVSARFFN